MGLSSEENQEIIRLFNNPVVTNYVNIGITVIALLIEVFLIGKLKDKFDKKKKEEFVKSIKFPKHIQG